MMHIIGLGNYSQMIDPSCYLPYFEKGNETFYIVDAVSADKNEKEKHAIIFDTAYDVRAVFEVTDAEYGFLVTFDRNTPAYPIDNIIRKAKSFLL